MTRTIQPSLTGGRGASAGGRKAGRSGLLSAVLRRKRWFAGGFLLTAALVLLAGSAMPGSYTGVALVTLGADSPGNGVPPVAGPDDAAVAARAVRSTGLLRRVARDPVVLRALAAQCEGPSDWHPSGWLTLVWRALSSQPAAACRSDVGSAASLDALAQAVSAQPGDQPRTVSIAATSPVPTTALLLANSFAEAFVADRRPETRVGQERNGRLRDAMASIENTVRRIEEVAADIRETPAPAAARPALNRLSRELAAARAQRGNTARGPNQPDSGDTLDRDLDIADAQMDTLDAQMASLAQAAGASLPADTLLAVLAQNAQTRRLILSDLASKADELDLRQPAPAGGARIARRAELPTHPRSPFWSTLLPGGTLLALLVGGIAAVARDRAGRGRREFAEAEPPPVQPSGLRVAGYVPRLTGLPELLTAMQESEASAVLDDAMRSIFAHAVLPRDPLPRVVLVASGNAAEGRTTLALALARFVARSGHRVIAVEADLRRPTFGSALGLPAGPGLAEHLAGQAELPEIIRTSPGNLPDLITAGSPESRDPASLLRPRLAALLDRLREDYDVVLIDSPPAAGSPEVEFLARHADGVLTCLPWGVADAAAVMARLRHLNLRRASLLGVVVNDLPGQGARSSGTGEVQGR